MKSLRKIMSSSRTSKPKVKTPAKVKTPDSVWITKRSRELQELQDRDNSVRSQKNTAVLPSIIERHELSPSPKVLSKRLDSNYNLEGELVTPTPKSGLISPPSPAITDEFNDNKFGLRNHHLRGDLHQAIKEERKIQTKRRKNALELNKKVNNEYDGKSRATDMLKNDPFFENSAKRWAGGIMKTKRKRKKYNKFTKKRKRKYQKKSKKR